MAAGRTLGAGGDPRYRRGELLLATEEDFGPPEEACKNRGQFTIASLEGSYDGQAWRSTPAEPLPPPGGRHLEPVREGGITARRGQYDPLARFCSAHYFDVDGSTVTYAWYGEGTRFLDISNPANPTQFAYWRPDDGIVWASYMHNGYVYTADRTRGVDVLRLTTAAPAARRGGRREVTAPRPSARQRRFLARPAPLQGRPGTSFLCVIETG